MREAMKELYVVYHTGFGHTKRQVEAVHRGAAAVEGIKAKLSVSRVSAAASRPRRWPASRG
jgi:hypothetical protein